MKIKVNNCLIKFTRMRNIVSVSYKLIKSMHYQEKCKKQKKLLTKLLTDEFTIQYMFLL